MLLTCDIGNTNIKAGIFVEDKLIEFHFFKEISQIVELISKNKFKDIVVSSVVPSRTKQLIDSLNELKLSPIIINKDSSFNLDIDYDSPDTLGIDRICSAEGAFYLFCKQREFKKEYLLLTIDLGTATTINIVKYPGVFAGGIIAPGTDLMFKSLKMDTAQLPQASLSDYKEIIGKSTNESIASGVLHSAAGLLERSIKLIQDNTNSEKVFIYITGGNFKNVEKLLKFSYIYEKGLVLYGIMAIYINTMKLNPHP
jgi:type III pantothenate kinase